MEPTNFSHFWGLFNITNILFVIFITLLVYYIWPVWNNALNHLPGPKPIPVLGNMLTYLRQGPAQTDIDLIKKYGKVFRIHIGREPAIVVADVDILRQILVKDFGNFTNRSQLYLRGILHYSLFFTSDDVWRRQRHVLSPYFASGKLKHMVPQITKCVKQLCQNMGKHSGPVEVKNVSGCFTMDAIASTGFGIDLNSQDNPKHPFVQNAKQVFLSTLRDPVNLIVNFAPFMIPVLDLFGVRVIKKEPVQFFSSLVAKLLKDRKDSKTEEMHDFLQLLITSNENSKLSFKEIVAQGILFFLAAFETTSSTLAFLMYELSRHHDIQEKLHQEIKEGTDSWSDCNYENVMKLSYLDQCIQETLRLYPALARVTRSASQDVEVNGLLIPKGTQIIIPINAIQHDPEIWNNPYEFDPSRFDPDQKESRSHFNHIPFGTGPRQCIGIRLAFLELKLAIVFLMRDFVLKPSDIKVELNGLNAAIRSKSGVWVKPEKRSSLTAN